MRDMLHAGLLAVPVFEGALKEAQGGPVARRLAGSACFLRTYETHMRLKRLKKDLSRAGCILPRAQAPLCRGLVCAKCVCVRGGGVKVRL